MPQLAANIHQIEILGSIKAVVFADQPGRVPGRFPYAERVRNARRHQRLVSTSADLVRVTGRHDGRARRDAERVRCDGVFNRYALSRQPFKRRRHANPVAVNAQRSRLELVTHDEQDVWPGHAFAFVLEDVAAP